MTISARIEARLNAIEMGSLARKRILERARSLSEECGCKASLVALLATALVLFACQQTGVDHALVSWAGLGWILGAAVAGKFAGLANARLQLRVIERRLAGFSQSKRAVQEAV